MEEPCQFDSCAEGDPAQGFNESDTRLNYVNSFPVVAMRYGIRTLGGKFFNGSGDGGADMAVAGVNVGGRKRPFFFFFLFAFSFRFFSVVAFPYSINKTHLPSASEPRLRDQVVRHRRRRRRGGERGRPRHRVQRRLGQSDLV